MSAGRFLLPLRRFCASHKPSVFISALENTTSLNCYVRHRKIYSNYSECTLLRRSFASQTETEPKADFATSSQEGDEQAAAENGTTEREKRFTEAIEKLKEENTSYLDKYKRSLAETENLRQRLTRQIEDAKHFGIQSFVKDLLEVSDLLSKAISSVPKDSLSDNNPALKDLHEGLRLTEAQMSKVFKNHGLEKYDPHGEIFDPNFHEAVFQVPVPGKEPGTIMEVSQSGFKLRNRVVRPARVGVVRNP